MLLTFGVVVLLSFPAFSSSDTGSLVLSESAYLTKAAMRVPISVQWRFIRPNFSFRGPNRQFPSNITTAVSALIRSDECKICDTRRTQWVVDSPSAWTQAVKSTIDMGCSHVSLKLLINRARNWAHEPMVLGGRLFNQVRAVPSSIIVKYFAQASSSTSSISIAIS